MISPLCGSDSLYGSTGSSSPFLRVGAIPSPSILNDLAVSVVVGLPLSDEQATTARPQIAMTVRQRKRDMLVPQVPVITRIPSASTSFSGRRLLALAAATRSAGRVSTSGFCAARALRAQIALDLCELVPREFPSCVALFRYLQRAVHSRCAG